MINENYGKLVGEYPEYLRLPVELQAPLIINGVTHPAGAHLSTNDDAAIKELGYKPVTRSPMPSKEGFYYTEVWEDSGEAIVQSWTERYTRVRYRLTSIPQNNIPMDGNFRNKSRTALFS